MLLFMLQSSCCHASCVSVCRIYVMVKPSVSSLSAILIIAFAFNVSHGGKTGHFFFFLHSTTVFSVSISDGSFLRCSVSIFMTFSTSPLVLPHVHM
uniref:Uncharacterized protein n=1 Tax=Rhipicephalus zambeziensis TaxID=60191 RepID=A0A224Y560_9ACAR